MRKSIPLILAFVCVSALFIGCSKTKENGKSINFSFDKNGNYVGFANLPSGYTIEKAKDDGYFVTQDSDIIANKDAWDKFVKASLNKKNSSIRIVEFYKENAQSPYFLDLFYNDGYYYSFDSSAQDQKKQPYLYLLTLEGKFGKPLKDSAAIVLTNDNTLTFDKFMKALISSSIKDDTPPYKLIMSR